MRAFTWLLFLATTLQTLGATTGDEQEILRLEDTIKNAWVRHDTAAIAAIVADDFQFWSFRGQRRSKADLLRAVEKTDETDTTVEDAAVRVYGDSAIYTARLMDIGKHADGLLYRTRSCLTAVFVRRAGKWQLVSEHQTIIPDTPNT
jgi:ketosteroid isomerase-like protein